MNSELLYADLSWRTRCCFGGPASTTETAAAEVLLRESQQLFMPLWICEDYLDCHEHDMSVPRIDETSDISAAKTRSLPGV
jgi:hypothetical protein